MKSSFDTAGGGTGPVVTSPQDLAALVSSGEHLVLNGAASFPLAFAEQLAARAAELSDVVLTHPMRREARPLAPDYLDVDPARIRHISEFTFDRPVRRAVQAGLADYRPNHPHQEAAGFGVQPARFDVVTSASPPDAAGRCSLGAFGGWIMPFVRHPGRHRILLEINHRQPRVHGDVSVALDEVHALAEVDEPLPQESAGAPDEVQSAIAAHVCGLIPDRATLQFGAGGLPNAVASQLSSSGMRHLSLYAEGFFSATVDLIEAGVIDNSGRELHRGKSVVALALGDQRVYDHLDDNQDVLMLPIAEVNDPATIAKNYRQTSINAALQVDLHGQCASETLGARHYSGTGGQWEFTVGATHAPEGRAIVALSSTALGGTVSTIVAGLAPGTAVTIPRNDVDYVVTEHGVAELRGRTTRERARALIAIAHPDFREELHRNAKQLGYPL